MLYEYQLLVTHSVYKMSGARTREEKIAAQITLGVAAAEKADRDLGKEAANKAVRKAWKQRMKDTATPKEEIERARAEAWLMAMLTTDEEPRPHLIYGPGF